MSQPLMLPTMPMEPVISNLGYTKDFNESALERGVLGDEFLGELARIKNNQQALENGVQWKIQDSRSEPIGILQNEKGVEKYKNTEDIEELSEIASDGFPIFPVQDHQAQMIDLRLIKIQGETPGGEVSGEIPGMAQIKNNSPLNNGPLKDGPLQIQNSEKVSPHTDVPERSGHLKINLDNIIKSPVISHVGSKEFQPPKTQSLLRGNTGSIDGAENQTHSGALRGLNLFDPYTQFPFSKPVSEGDSFAENRIDEIKNGKAEEFEVGTKDNFLRELPIKVDSKAPHLASDSWDHAEAKFAGALPEGEKSLFTGSDFLRLLGRVHHSTGKHPIQGSRAQVDESKKGEESQRLLNLPSSDSGFLEVLGTSVPTSITQNSEGPRVISGQVVLGAMARSRLSTESLGEVSTEIRNFIQTKFGNNSQREEGEIRIRLKPDSLGEMRLKVSTVGGQVALTVIASSEKARQIIEESLPHLKENLAYHQLSLGSFDIGVKPMLQSQQGFELSPQHDFGSTDGLFGNSANGIMEGCSWNSSGVFPGQAGSSNTQADSENPWRMGDMPQGDPQAGLNSNQKRNGYQNFSQDIDSPGSILKTGPLPATLGGRSGYLGHGGARINVLA